MVRRLFNDLVTALDIIPNSSTIDLCVHHPSTCSLTGKVRILAKRPCVYKSLVLTVTGTTRVLSRQGSRTVKAKQAFLYVSKEIVYENAIPTQRNRRPDSMLSTLARGAVAVTATAAAAPTMNAQRDSSDSSSSSSLALSQTSALADLFAQPSTITQASASVSATGGRSTQVHIPIVQNQLKEGVNDIEFKIEFPSHLQQQQQQASPSREEQLCTIPSGPIKSTSGDSSITYTLSATLAMSRRDILVNNHISASIPFRVQNWQDSIDWRRSEDHSYHGKRRDKIEFQFQVPKQLDLRRLQDLQFGFQASWRSLQDDLKVKEIQYYIVEEEQQAMAIRTAPVISMSIISTSATHDCSGYSVPTNTWGYLRAAARLQIPQPNIVLETTAMPWPHTLTISHKLRVLIKFDQTRAKERDLQLSFPISIHPTLEEDGSPVHQDIHYTPHTRRRRRRGHALYGIDIRQDGEDGESDGEEGPLPMYADREGTLLLMVGQEVQETSFQGDEPD
ncbi:hypothetical protein BGZ65_005418, partial [Modicella reniformis]